MEKKVIILIFFILLLFNPTAAEVKQESVIPFPKWGKPQSRDWPIRFKSDLDIIAPLGKGAKNAAIWFKDFMKFKGPRWSEFEKARRKGGEYGSIGRLDPGHPLLLEAEEWCNQARLRFYPEVIPLAAENTKVISLLVPLVLANSWIARGNKCKNPADALLDFQRVIRLGRLWRQDDTIVYSDLGGLECIRMGAQAIYDLAVRIKDFRLAANAAVILSEYIPQRVLTTRQLNSLYIYPFTKKGKDKAVIHLPRSSFKDIRHMASSAPDRRFRLEAIFTLSYIIHYGTLKQIGESVKLLRTLSKSDDQIIAVSANFALKNRPGLEELDERNKPRPGMF
jgi:hypothetical protein